MGMLHPNPELLGYLEAETETCMPKYLGAVRLLAWQTR